MPEVKYHRLCHERKSKRVCIFSTYDEDSVVQDYVLHCLSEIKRYGFEVIFVSTSEGINERDEEKVAEFSSNIVVRENEGYDFTSWKVGTKYISWDTAETILFLNDSIIFPLYDFAEEMESMVRSETDFWGLIDSKSNGHFINSFFWLFNKRIVESDWFVEYCDGINVGTKKFYVEQYEAKIIDQLNINGFSYDTFIKCENIYQKRGFKNFKEYTHYRLFWDILYTELGSPFLKKNILIKGNKEYLIYTENAVNVVRQMGGTYRQIASLLTNKNVKTSMCINALTDCISRWLANCGYKKIYIYGDSFAGRILSFVTNSRTIYFDQLENKLKFVKTSVDTSNTLYDLQVENIECVIIASFKNHLEIHEKLLKLLPETEITNIQGVLKSVPNFVNYFENLSLNIKYCLALAKIKNIGCSITVNSNFAELFGFCVKGLEREFIDVSENSYFFRLYKQGKIYELL